MRSPLSSGRKEAWRGNGEPAAPRADGGEAVQQDLRTRSTARTRRVLGDLKGGALKAGQLLSTVEALLPADPEQSWREALSSLQANAGALPFAEVEPVLLAELRRWLPGFDNSPGSL